MTRALVFGLIVLLSSSLAQAGPQEQAEIAFRTRDFATARITAYTLAEQGNVDAQKLLAASYEEDSPPDTRAALKWYRRAADAGDVSAQFRLMQLYLGGSGVPRDLSQHLEWTRRCALQGNDICENWLGRIYERGELVPRDPVEAMKWYVVAASGPSPQIFALDRNRLAAELSDPQRAEANARAAEWKPRSEH
jgi:TPR repeat protein